MKGIHGAMKPPKPTTGELGWLGLVVYVVAVDSLAWRQQCKGKECGETMSVAFGKSLQHPYARIGTLAAWGVVTAHLFWSLPLPGAKSLKKFVTRL